MTHALQASALLLGDELLSMPVLVMPFASALLFPLICFVQSRLYRPVLSPFIHVFPFLRRSLVAVVVLPVFWLLSILTVALVAAKSLIILCLLLPGVVSWRQLILVLLTPHLLLVTCQLTHVAFLVPAPPSILFAVMLLRILAIWLVLV